MPQAGASVPADISHACTCLCSLADLLLWNGRVSIDAQRMQGRCFIRTGLLLQTFRRECWAEPCRRHIARGAGLCGQVYRCCPGAPSRRPAAQPSAVCHSCARSAQKGDRAPLLDHVALPHVAPHTLPCLCGVTFAEQLHVPSCARGCCDEQQQDQAACSLEAALCSLSGRTFGVATCGVPSPRLAAQAPVIISAGCRLSVGAGVFLDFM